MTTIAWDGRTLATDAGHLQRHDGGLIASESAEMLAWFRDGAQSNRFPVGGDMLLHISPRGELRIYDQSPHPVTFGPQPVAVGFRARCALSTMQAGFNAVGAVVCAALRTPARLKTLELDQ